MRRETGDDEHGWLDVPPTVWSFVAGEESTRQSGGGGA